MKAKFKEILPVIERKGCPWSRLEVCRVTVSLVASPVCRPMPSIPPRVPSVEPPTREPRVPVSLCPCVPATLCLCVHRTPWPTTPNVASKMSGGKAGFFWHSYLRYPLKFLLWGVNCQCIFAFAFRTLQHLILKSIPKYWAIFKMKLLISLHLQFVLVQRKYDQGGC